MSKKIRQTATAVRRAAILAATLELVGEKGVTAVTMSDICARSGASVGSVYHHFKDREGVLYGLYKDCFDDCFSQLRTAVVATTEAKSGIKTLVHTYLDWVAANPVRAAFIYEASQGTLLRSYQADILAFKGAFYADIFAWMLPFVESGELLRLPPWAYDAIIMGPAHEFARRWLGGMQELAFEEAKNIIATAVWRAVSLS
ncbi:TetR/AcrR family transcriptional regulator [Candidatus Leptofilum sp.]|uniref:TetR/AcrR family transcriptional regulator n=1 Tax=Candidatus Leptofilum sp. TaxID=3241576 RepID=UPI003B5C3F47